MAGMDLEIFQKKHNVFLKTLIIIRSTHMIHNPTILIDGSSLNTIESYRILIDTFYYNITILLYIVRRVYSL